MLTKALVDKAAAVFDVYGADAWYERPIEEFVPDGHDVRRVRRHRVRARGQHPRRVVRFGIEPRGGAAVPRGSSLAGRHLSRRQRSASRLVPQLAAGRHRHARPRAVRPGADARLRRWTSRAARCRSRSATPSRRRTSSSRAAPRSCGCGSSMVDYRDDISLGKEILARTVESLSQVPQRDPRAGREPLRLRSERRRRAEGEDARDRSLGAGAVRRRRGADRQGLRRLRLSGDLPGREPVRSPST